MKVKTLYEKTFSNKTLHLCFLISWIIFEMIWTSSIFLYDDYFGFENSLNKLFEPIYQDWETTDPSYYYTGNIFVVVFVLVVHSVLRLCLPLVICCTICFLYFGLGVIVFRNDIVEEQK